MNQKNRQTQVSHIKVDRLGHKNNGLTDFFHYAMSGSWLRLILLVGGVLLATNLVYALIYWLLPESISNLGQEHRFWNCFFFSIQTMSTLGYGVMAPVSLAANGIAMTEAFTGLLAFAFASGLMFSKFARPTAKILFSDKAVVTVFNGQKHLSLRLANQRTNQILEGSVRLSCLRDEVSKEGDRTRRFHDMKLVRDRTPVFALTWTLLHPIDTESPLYNKTIEELNAEEFSLIVTFTGLDETFSQTVHARFFYSMSDILWHAKFVDIMTRLPDGRRQINLELFHETKPMQDISPK